MIRATTGGVLRSYRSNLMKSFISQNNAMNTIISQRTFNTYAEDPASAAKAFRLRKSRMTVHSQSDICNDTLKKFETGFSSLQSIDDVLDTKDGQYGMYMKTLKGTTQSMLNDPEGDAREQLNKVLDQMSEMLVQNMNQKYGDNFIFAGADGHNVPFEVKSMEDGTKQLFYRGVSVDAHVPAIWKSTGNPAAPMLVDANGQYDPAAVPVNYLKMDNARILSQKEYASLYTEPQATRGDLIDANGDPVIGADGNPIQVNQEYNSNGTIKQAGDEGGYYKLENSIAGYDAGSIISIDEYLAAKSRAINRPAILQDAAGNLNVDKNGQPAASTNDPAQDYYIVVDGSFKDQVISKEDYDAAKLEADKLDYLANEKLFVDIGLGFQENEDGKLIESSAYDASLIGIRFLGYGQDEDGDPKNLYSLVQKMKEVSDSVPEAGKWDNATWEEFDRLVGKFETACSSFKTEFTDMAAGTTKLGTNAQLLEDNFYNLQEQYAELEDIEPVEAINNFLWAQYAYNAALKVGNSVLSQSLMDYLN